MQEPMTWERLQEMARRLNANGRAFMNDAVRPAMSDAADVIGQQARRGVGAARQAAQTVQQQAPGYYDRTMNAARGGLKYLRNLGGTPNVPNATAAGGAGTPPEAPGTFESAAERSSFGKKVPTFGEPTVPVAEKAGRFRRALGGRGSSWLGGKATGIGTAAWLGKQAWDVGHADTEDIRAGLDIQRDPRTAQAETGNPIMDLWNDTPLRRDLADRARYAGQQLLGGDEVGTAPAAKPTPAAAAPVSAGSIPADFSKPLPDGGIQFSGTGSDGQTGMFGTLPALTPSGHKVDPTTGRTMVTFGSQPGIQSGGTLSVPTDLRAQQGLRRDPATMVNPRASGPYKFGNGSGTVNVVPSSFFTDPIDDGGRGVQIALERDTRARNDAAADRRSEAAVQDLNTNLARKAVSGRAWDETEQTAGLRRNNAIAQLAELEKAQASGINGLDLVKFQRQLAQDAEKSYRYQQRTNILASREKREASADRRTATRSYVESHPRNKVLPGDSPKEAARKQSQAAEDLDYLNRSSHPPKTDEDASTMLDMKSLEGDLAELAQETSRWAGGSRAGRVVGDVMEAAGKPLRVFPGVTAGKGSVPDTPELDPDKTQELVNDVLKNYEKTGKLVYKGEELDPASVFPAGDASRRQLLNSLQAKFKLKRKI